MGNCFGTQVDHHSPNNTSKSTTSEISRNTLRSGGSSNNNSTEHGKLRIQEHVNDVTNETIPTPPSGKIITPNLKMFTLAELKAATRNFRPDTVLGEGGFGRVFKGWVDEETFAPSKVGVGMAIAVKKSNADSYDRLQEWQAEVKFLGKFSHPNLVRLLGYCWEEKQFLLVYEYMQKGSLETHLFRKGVAPLPWELRLKVMIGAAQGLAFLHTSEKSVIYRDFKSSNILLDGAYNAKLSDFGLAKLGPINGNSHVTTRIMGTYGYAAPEYIATGHLYVKSDVYGFGVVLLEMLTGLQALDTNRPAGEQNLVDWAKPFLSSKTKTKLKKIMDSRLEDKYPSRGAFQAAELILKCLESDPKNRPSMEQVLDALEQINAIKEKPKESKSKCKSSANDKGKGKEEKSAHQHYRGHRRSPIHSKQSGNSTATRPYRLPSPVRAH